MAASFRPRGTRNASTASVTEALLICTALVETVLVAGFVLRAGRIGEGGTITEAFLQATALILLPFRFMPAAVSATVRQGLAIVVYGGGLLVLVGISSWLERRRALS